MPYGTPQIEDGIEYYADFHNAVGYEGINVSVRLVQSNEGGLSVAAKDAIFQDVLDALTAVASIEPHGASWRRGTVGTEITPTP